jgi:hypothetical protein
VTHANQKARFEKTWGYLAKSVLDLAFEDLEPVKLDGNPLNVEKVKKDARQFFESRRFRPWAEAAGLSRGDVEEAYIDMVKGENE